MAKVENNGGTTKAMEGRIRRNRWPERVKGLGKLPFPTRSIQCGGICGLRFVFCIREAGKYLFHSARPETKLWRTKDVNTADNAMEW